MRATTTRRNTTSVKHARMLASLVAAGALLAAPAAGLAAKPEGKGKPAKANACKAVKKAFVVHGTFVSGAVDNPATVGVNEATVTLTVTSANGHATRSGDIADQDAVASGVQVAGATYTVPTTDAYVLKLNGYEGTDTASAGDRVKVMGKVAVTKKRCAAAGTSIADRYGAVDVKKVTISDMDADA